MPTFRKQLNDMVTTDRGKLSNTKVWAFVGCAVATWVIIHLTMADKMTWELFVAYLGTVAGFSQVSKWLSYRYGGNAVTTPATAESGANTVVTKCPDCTTKPKKEEEGQD